ncbi:putative regulator of chromosome condensation 1/beta-lactamase-inhibitor protein II [Plasmopara halstedii]
MATNHLLTIDPDSDDEDNGAGVFTFGQNTYGELALGDTNDRSIPTRVELGTSSDQIHVVDVACGNEHTVILYENGDVFTCGYNNNGQCATGTTEQVPTPQFSAGLSSNRSVRVFSGNGSEHLAAISEKGNLYTVGLNTCGQLGLGTATSIAEASLVKGMAGRRVVDVACSYFHTAIVTDDGHLFACGCNDFGQLGMGDHSSQLIPRLVEYFLRCPVLAVACGQHFTVVSLKDGGVVGFGKNDHGQLGLDCMSEPVLEPTRLASPLDKAVVPQLSCGYHHTAIVTEGGALYTFGRNDYGQLGQGHKRHMAKPTVCQELTTQS